MNYFIILWVGSGINDTCIVHTIRVPRSFDSHTDCVTTGYKEGHNVFLAIEQKLAAKQRHFVAFHCNVKSSI